MTTTPVQNWFGSIVSHPAVVVRVSTVEEIVAIVRDRERYPSPVRAVGSNHSTTPCGVADGGTLIVMTGMDRIHAIHHDTVTADAGALYIDVNEALARRGLQFYVNVELGNLSMGSAATGGTKDASMPGEMGQIASYAVGMRMVTPDGGLLEVTEDEPELLQMARSSYGLLGIVYEVTFRVRPRAALDVHHETFSLEQFSVQLPQLVARGASMMMYFNPFTGKVTVEFRRYHDPRPGRRFTRWQWRLRNHVWSKLAPMFAYRVSKHVRMRWLRDKLLDGFNGIVIVALHRLVRGRSTSPQAQQIRYPEKSDNARYTFSIWAFPEERYVDCLRAYFDFCREHYDRTGYRADLLSVGYRILEDQASLFSYSFDGTVLTFDPVSTGNPGWTEFLDEYNELCSGLGGVPLFNQTNQLTRAQVRRAFGDRVQRFEERRRAADPDGRLLNAYFAELFGDGPAGEEPPRQRSSSEQRGGQAGRSSRPEPRQESRQEADRPAGTRQE